MLRVAPGLVGFQKQETDPMIPFASDTTDWPTAIICLGVLAYLAFLAWVMMR